MPFQLSTRRITVTDNRELDTIARYLGDPLDDLLKVPILNGILLKDIELGLGETQIEHKLNRPIAGYLIVRQSAFANINDGTPSELPNRFINLESSAAVTVSLWVF